MYVLDNLMDIMLIRLVNINTLQQWHQLVLEYSMQIEFQEDVLTNVLMEPTPSLLPNIAN